MYLWYQKANVCFAYIEDWPSELTWADLSSIIPVDGTGSYGLDELEAGENELSTISKNPNPKNIYLMIRYPMGSNLKNYCTMNSDLSAVEAEKPGQSTLHWKAPDLKIVKFHREAI